MQDSEYPQLLASVDEMGRSCCYDANDSSVRFLCTPLLMLQFDASGNTRRKIKSSTTAEGISSPPQFQPISLPLGKSITLKCNQVSSLPTE